MTKQAKQCAGTGTGKYLCHGGVEVGFPLFPLVKDACLSMAWVGRSALCGDPGRLEAVGSLYIRNSGLDASSTISVGTAFHLEGARI